MTADQFEHAFACPSWCGIVWCFWRVSQAALDGAGGGKEVRGQSLHDPDFSGRISPTTHLNSSRVRDVSDHPSFHPENKPFGADISEVGNRGAGRCGGGGEREIEREEELHRVNIVAPARRYAKKFSNFTNSVLLLSQRRYAMAPPSGTLPPPPLDPQALSRRLREQTPKCPETSGVAVVGAQELKAAVPLLRDLIAEAGGGWCDDALAKQVEDVAGKVAELRDEAMYLLHLPEGGGGDQALEFSEGLEDGTEWPHAPPPPPPPPLPTRSSELARQRESADSVSHRVERRELSLKRGMARALQDKEELERWKKGAVLTPAVLAKRQPPPSKYNREEWDGGGVGGRGGGGGGGGPRQEVGRVVVTDVNNTSIRVRNLRDYADPPTYYEQTMK
jgi:hypothetical protein